MTRAIICETHQEAEQVAGERRAEGEIVTVQASYLIPAEKLTDVMTELRLQRMIEDMCGISRATASKAVGVVLGWLRREGSTKWVVLST